MLSAAITLLFTLAGALALAVIASSLLEAHAAYVRLMREGDMLRAAMALQAAARDMRLRSQALPAQRRAFVTQRSAHLPLRACVAA